MSSEKKEKTAAMVAETKAQKDAEKARRREEQKALRRANRESGVIGMVKLYITTKLLNDGPVSEECPKCLALNSAA